MPADAKLLFRPKAVRPHLASFALPDRVDGLRGVLANWAELISTGRIDLLGERELLPDFLTDFFQNLRGYSGPTAGGTGAAGRYNFSHEKQVQVGGKYADAVIGQFHGGPVGAARHDAACPDAAPTFPVAIERKGP